MKKIFSFLNISQDVTINCLAPKNQASEVKSEFLMRILMGQFPGARLVKSILPIKFRRNLGIKLRRLNMRPLKNAPKINDALAQSLRRLYDADLAKLEILLNRDFSRWRGKSCG